MYNQACVCDIKSTKDLEPEEFLSSSSALPGHLDTWIYDAKIVTYWFITGVTSKIILRFFTIVLLLAEVFKSV